MASATAPSIVLTIPFAPPPSLNVQERLHWAKRRELRKRWEEEAWVAWFKAGKPRFKHPRIEVRLFYPMRRKRDLDNAFAAVKPIIDGLKGHAFHDDSVEDIELRLSIGVDREYPRVEIRIREQ